MEGHKLHVGIIMDGNGRWAQRRGFPRLLGHVEGERALRSIVSAAPECGIGMLTVYAFSSDNWKRPAEEVSGLMRLFQTHLSRCVASCRKQGVRLSVIGRRDRLPDSIRASIHRVEKQTAEGTRLHLRLAVDYSSRDSLLAVLQQEGVKDRAGVTSGLNSPDVDLLIRTGGEQRLSDFLLWECAYAELLFTPRLWPDFAPADLRAALETYRQRERRFGGLPATAQSGLAIA